MRWMNLRKLADLHIKSFALGIIFSVFVIGCAGFQYRYYGIAPVSYEGKLLGPTPSEDLPLSVCMPDAQVKGKCVVMLVDEFTKFRQDYDRVKTELKDCQSQ